MNYCERSIFLLLLVIVTSGMSEEQRTWIAIYGPGHRNLSNTYYEYTTEEKIQLTCNFVCVREKFRLTWSIDGKIVKTLPVNINHYLRVLNVTVSVGAERVATCQAQETPAGGTNFSSFVHFIKKNVSTEEHGSRSVLPADRAEGGSEDVNATSSGGARADAAHYVYAAGGAAAAAAAAAALLLAVLLLKQLCRKNLRHYHPESQPDADADADAGYAVPYAGGAAAGGALYSMPVPKSQRNKKKPTTKNEYSVPYDC